MGSLYCILIRFIDQQIFLPVVPFLLTIPNLLAHKVDEEVMFKDGENHTIFTITVIQS